MSDLEKIDACLTSLAIGLEELKEQRAENLSGFVNMAEVAINDLVLCLEEMYEAISRLGYAQVGGLN